MKIYLVLVVLLIGLMGCVTKHESRLITQERWYELGEYYGMHGYRRLSASNLDHFGADEVIDHNAYQAGYRKGRIEFCLKNDLRFTVVNPHYPGECSAARRNLPNNEIGEIAQGGY